MSLPNIAAAPVAAAPAAAANISVADLARRLTKSSSAENAQDPGSKQPDADDGSNENDTDTTETGSDSQEVTQGREGAEAQGDESAEGQDGEAAGEGAEAAGNEPGAEATDGTDGTEGTNEADPHATAAETVEAILEAVKEAGSDPKLVSKSLVKRIHALADQRDQQRNERLRLTEENQQLTERLKSAGNGDGATALDPAPLSPEIATIDKQLAQAQQVIDWAEANPDGASVPDGKGGQVEYSAEQIRRFLGKATRDLTVLSGRRESRVVRLQEEHSTKVKAAQAQASEAYPWTKNQKSPEYQEAMAMVREVPELTLRADWPLVLSWIVEGKKAYAAKAAAPAPAKALGKPLNGKPNGSRTPPPVVAAPAAAAPKVNAAQRAVQELEATYRKTGSTSDYAKVLAAKARARARGN